MFDLEQNETFPKVVTKFYFFYCQHQNRKAQGHYLAIKSNYGYLSYFKY